MDNCGVCGKMNKKNFGITLSVNYVFQRGSSWHWSICPDCAPDRSAVAGALHKLVETIKEHL